MEMFNRLIILFLLLQPIKSAHAQFTIELCDFNMETFKQVVEDSTNILDFKDYSNVHIWVKDQDTLRASFVLDSAKNLIHETYYFDRLSMTILKDPNTNIPNYISLSSKDSLSGSIDGTIDFTIANDLDILGWRHHSEQGIQTVYTQEKANKLTLFSRGKYIDGEFCPMGKVFHYYPSGLVRESGFVEIETGNGSVILYKENGLIDRITTYSNFKVKEIHVYTYADGNINVVVHRN